MVLESCLSQDQQIDCVCVCVSELFLPAEIKCITIQNLRFNVDCNVSGPK